MAVGNGDHLINLNRVGRWIKRSSTWRRAWRRSPIAKSR